jgi:WS/DGAT/MGAT family acyltransferase
MQPFAERLSSRDRLFLDLEGPSVPQHVAVLCWLDAKPLRGADGTLDLAAIRRRVASRLGAVPRTRQRLAFAPVDRHPVWVDDAQFDLALHVLHTALPKGGGERELAKLVGRLLAEPLDRERPLWELWFIEGVTRARCALLAKVHHCMVDGIGGLDWFGRLLVTAKGEPAEDPAPWTPRLAPDRDELLRSEIGHRAEKWLGALRKLPHWLESREELESLASRAVERATSLGEALSAALEPAPATPWNAPLGALRSFAWRSLEMSRVEALRHALGGTLNEVALACVAGALRAHLIAEGAEVEGLTLRASMPVNRRRADDTHEGGNRVAICVVELAVGIADVRERYAAIRAASARAKASHQVQGLELLDEVAELTTSALVGAAARVALQSRPFNLVVTNIPGPRKPLHLLGAKLHALVPVVNLTEGVGLGVALASYAGQLSFGCIADPHLVPGLAAFADGILASFEELEKSVA